MKIKLGNKETIHFVGIGGIGMSGLANPLIPIPPIPTKCIVSLFPSLIFID